MLRTLLNKTALTITAAQKDCHWQDLVYELKVSKKRHSIGFRVSAKGVVVSVPYGLDESRLDEAFTAKYGWLKAKLEQLSVQTDSGYKLPAQLQDGDSWPVFGKSLCVHIKVGKVHTITVHADHVQVVFTARQASAPCRWRLWQQWYRQQAMEFAHQRVGYWVQQMSGQLPRLPAAVAVRYYRSRWGSCSSKAELKFNYLLAMVPEPVFDYVVVHELCHLRHMHHGREFWAMVAVYCPGWKQQRQWLKRQGHSLLMVLST